MPIAREAGDSEEASEPSSGWLFDAAVGGASSGRSAASERALVSTCKTSPGALPPRAGMSVALNPLQLRGVNHVTPPVIARQTFGHITRGSEVV